VPLELHSSNPEAFRSRNIKDFFDLGLKRGWRIKPNTHPYIMLILRVHGKVSPYCHTLHGTVLMHIDNF
jgi:hypothetical protein